MTDLAQMEFFLVLSDRYRHGSSTYSQLGANGPPSAVAVAINLRPSAPRSRHFLESGAQCVRISTETILQELKKIAIILIETVDRGASPTVRGLVRHFRIGRRGEDTGRGGCAAPARAPLDDDPHGEVLNRLTYWNGW